MNIGDSYAAALESFKALCRGPSESLAIARLIREHICVRTPRMLDVGTADGAACGRLSEYLRRAGIEAEITGIDIREQHSSVVASRLATPRYKFKLADFHSFLNETDFHLVVIRQTIYYLGDIRTTLRLARRVAAPSGLIVIVCWNGSCILRRILNHVDRENPALLIDEAAVLSAVSVESMRVVAQERLRGELDLKLSRIDPGLLTRSLQILLRGRSLSADAERSLDRFLAMECADTEIRENSILLISSD